MDMSQGARRRRSRAYTRATQLPMVVLSVVWIVLFIVQLTSRPSPVLGALGTLVWLTFIADFVIKLVLTPVRGTFLKHNWITVISLLLPAVSLLRITQVAAVLANAAGGRAFMLARMLAHANRGLNALGASFHRRGAGYVAMLTLLVAALGAAGMLSFENHNPDGRACTTIRRPSGGPR